MLTTQFLEKLALQEDVATFVTTLNPQSEEYFFAKLLLLQSTDHPTNEESELLSQFESLHPTSEELDTVRIRYLFRSLDDASLDDPSQRFTILLQLAKLLSIDDVFTSKHVQSSLELLPSTLDPSLYSVQELVASNSTTRITQLSTAAYPLINADSVIHSDIPQDDLVRFITGVPCFVTFPNLFPIVRHLLNKKGKNWYKKLNLRKKLDRDQLLILNAELKDLILVEQFFSDLITSLIPSDEHISVHSLKSFYLEVWEVIHELSFTVFPAFVCQFFSTLLSFFIEINHFNEEMFMFYLEKTKNCQSIGYEITSSLPEQILPSQVLSREEIIWKLLIELFKEERPLHPFNCLVEETMFKRAVLFTKMVHNSSDFQEFQQSCDSSLVNSVIEMKVVTIDATPQYLIDPSSSDKLSVNISLKNVEQASLNIFIIDTECYYQQNVQSINNSIKLDGFKPNYVITLPSVPPSQLTNTVIDLPDSHTRGVFVVELVADDMRSRTVVSKGRCHVVEKVLACGHYFKLFDDKGAAVESFKVSLGIGSDRMEKQSENGHVLLPLLSSESKCTTQTVVFTLSDGYSFPHSFERAVEAWRFSCCFSPLAELIKPGKQVEIPFRTTLFSCNDIPCEIKNLQNFTIVATLLQSDERRSVEVFSNIELFDCGVGLVKLNIPDDLKSINFNCSARVQSVLNPSVWFDLNDSFCYNISARDENHYISNPFLRLNEDSSFSIQLLGLNGEVVPNSKIELELFPFVMMDSLKFHLQSNEQGMVDLGSLKGISSMKVSSLSNEFESRQYDLTLSSYRINTDQPFCFSTIDSIRFPLPKANFYDCTLVSFPFEYQTPHLVKNQIKPSNNSIIELDTLPVGKYKLYCSGNGILEDFVFNFVISGTLDQGFACSPYRIFEHNVPNLFFLSSEVFADEVSLSIKGLDDSCRLHVIKSHFIQNFSCKVFDPIPSTSAFASKHNGPFDHCTQTKLSKEAQYVLLRQSQPHRIGVTAPPPSMLTVPERCSQVVPFPRSTNSLHVEGEDMKEGKIATCKSTSNLSVTARSSLVGSKSSNNQNFIMDFVCADLDSTFNLDIESDHSIKIPLDDQVSVYTIVVQSITCTMVFTYGQTPKILPSRDVFVSPKVVMNKDQNFVQNEGCKFLNTGEEINVEGHQFAVVSSISQLFDLCGALCPNIKLDEFFFMKNWNNFSFDQKCEKFSKYCSNELCLFIKLKDLEFFNSVVKDYIQNRLEFSFIDDYLLDNDLSPYAQFPFSTLNPLEKVLLVTWLKKNNDIAGASAINRQLQEDSGFFEPPISFVSRWIQTAISTNKVEEPSSSDGESDGELMEEPPESLLREEESFKAFEALDLDEMEADLDGLGSVQSCSLTMPAKGMKKATSRSKKKTRRQTPPKVFGAGMAPPPPAPPAPMYIPSETTKEYVEQRYWNLDDGDCNFIDQYSKFLADLSSHLLTNEDLKGFVSENFVHLASKPSLNMILLAISLMDLSLVPSTERAFELRKNQLGTSLTANQPLMVFYSGVQPSTVPFSPSAMVAMAFLDPISVNDQGEIAEVFEFVSRKVFCCEVSVISLVNHSQDVDVIYQFPVGSIPLSTSNSIVVDSVKLTGHYSQKYYFYFPKAGTYTFSPARVSANSPIAVAQSPYNDSFSLNVASESQSIGWKEIALKGTLKQVVNYLENEIANLADDDLALLEPRMNTREDFECLYQLLKSNYRFVPCLFKYSFKHATSGELVPLYHYLEGNAPFTRLIGPYFKSKSFLVNGFEDKLLELVELAGFARQRVFEFEGNNYHFLPEFEKNYKNFIKYFLNSPQKPYDLLLFSYHLVVNGKLSEASKLYEKAKCLGQNSTDCLFENAYYQKLYLECFLFLVDPTMEKDELNSQLQKGLACPIPHLKKNFIEMYNLVNPKSDQSYGEELGDDLSLKNSVRREARPSCQVKFDSEQGKLNISVVSCTKLMVKFSQIDPEVLFSSSPFTEMEADQSIPIKTDYVMTYDVDQSQHYFQLDLPKTQQHFQARVIVENAKYVKHQIINCLSNDFKLRISPEAGQLALIPGTPTSSIGYVKVFSRHHDGSIHFYKDGYTDRSLFFDYCSLSTTDLEKTAKFSIYVTIHGFGAKIIKVDPPKM
ncbi:hypothetical protein P9112_012381 [Eukaryota sp. TZLM1-RC]